MNIVTIRTARFLLRPLTSQDVNGTYLGWLRDPEIVKYLGAIDSQIASVTQYVAERQGRDDVLFLGLFLSDSGRHIGNLKFEPVDSRNGWARLGILIGDRTWWGRGVAAEVATASGAWLYQHRGVSEIVLGVERGNRSAIRAYEKCGFVEVAKDDRFEVPPTALKMLRRHTA